MTEYFAFLQFFDCKIHVKYWFSKILIFKGKVNMFHHKIVLKFIKYLLNFPNSFKKFLQMGNI